VSEWILIIVLGFWLSLCLIDLVLGDKAGQWAYELGRKQRAFLIKHNMLPKAWESDDE